MMYLKLFNITEIAAVLEGIPNGLKADVWFKNFYTREYNYWVSEGIMRF
jgi:hypothetical protein